MTTKPNKRKPRNHRATILARRAAVQRLLSPSRFKESLSLASHPSPYMGSIAGLQAALTLLVAIVLVRYSLWPELVGFAALGALAALFGRFAPLPNATALSGFVLHN